jgi:signal transduction histidine kinase
LLRELPVPSPLENRSFFEALRYEVEEELRGHFDSVEWFVDEDAARFVDEAPPFLSTTLFFAAREAIRNAARHGRGGDVSRTLGLKIGAHKREMWILSIEDDGAGRTPFVDESRESGGSQSGLTLHAALLAVAGGQLSLDGSAQGTRVELRLPI